MKFAIDVSQGKVTWKDIAKNVSNLTSGLNGIIKAIPNKEGSRGIWARLLNLEAKKVNGFDGALIDEIGKYAGKSGIGSALAKWAGVFASGVENWFTYNDDTKYAGLDTLQKWEHIVGKTAVDVVYGAVIAAGAAAVVGTGGIAALVLGAGVKWAADEMVKHITEACCGESYGLTEVITNVAIDGVPVYRSKWAGSK